MFPSTKACGVVVPRGDRRRGYVLHLTSIANLASIWAEGALIASSQLPDHVEVDELGSRKIKQDRATRPVRCAPGRFVGDYVPFYYCARSPMLYFAHTKNPLSPFVGPQSDLVHLVSHIDVISEFGIDFAITDRNAALSYAAFSDDLEDLDQLVDWTLQAQKYWNDTRDEPDRMERRMAEFLVYDRCPVEALVGLGVMDESAKAQVEVALAGFAHAPIHVTRNWYY